MFSRLKLAGLTAEFIGTAVLVLVVLVMSQVTNAPYFFATTIGVTVVLLYAAFGSVSGGHFNPALTFGLWTARQMGTIRAISYIAAQLLGGVAAWQLYQYLTGRALPTKAAAYSTPVLVAEAAGAFVLVLAVASFVARGIDALQTALAYGAAYFGGILLASAAAASYINPALALGVRSFNWVHVLGPLIGGLVGANLYALLFAPAPARVTTSATVVSRRTTTRTSKKRR